MKRTRLRLDGSQTSSGCTGRGNARHLALPSRFAVELPISQESNAAPTLQLESRCPECSTVIDEQYKGSFVSKASLWIAASRRCLGCWRRSTVVATEPGEASAGRGALDRCESQPMGRCSGIDAALGQVGFGRWCMYVGLLQIQHQRRTDTAENADRQSQ